jgi:phage shock protein A
MSTNGNGLRGFLIVAAATGILGAPVDARADDREVEQLKSAVEEMQRALEAMKSRIEELEREKAAAPQPAADEPRPRP